MLSTATPAAIANDDHPRLGAALVDPYGNVGYVVEILPGQPGCFVIGRGMQPVREEYLVAFDNRLSTLSDGIAAPMFDRAAHLPKATDLMERRARAEAATAATRDRARLASEESARRGAAFLAEARERTPEWAKAVIVAELVEDQSDSMTDYFGSTTTRTVLLAWSRHTRDLFPEMRAAAATFEETAELATAPTDAEHREKYSMGAGYYLKNGWRDSDGWKVSKKTLYRGAESVPLGEWAIPDATEEAAPAPVASGAAMTVQSVHHTKRNCEMWLCVLGERVDRPEFERLRDAAKTAGGWYSKPWGGTPGGFMFDTEATARAFAGAGDTEAEKPAAREPVAKSAPPAAAGIGARLREMADGLESLIADKFADRRMNTPKQQKQAADARQDGCDLQRAQAMMRALADLHDAGNVPATLGKVRTKAAFLDFARERLDHSRGGYYDAGRPTGEPASREPVARELWDLVAGKADPEAAKAAELAARIAKLKFAGIEGYFPTPAALVARMIEAARIKGGERVLEPSAGSGAIADALKAEGCEVVCVERHATLCGILSDKGHAVIQSDFREVGDLGGQFDTVLMNPPFERGQDLEHVARAFGYLKPGGRLVAIMGAGVRFRQDRRFAEFREWAERLGGEFEDVQAGTFKESGTGVASVMLILDAEG